MKYLQIILTCLPIIIKSHEIDPKRFDEYQVYQVTPKNLRQFEVLKKLELSNVYDFWKSLSGVEHPVDIMVSPTLTNEFIDAMNAAEMLPQLLISNVQSLIDVESFQSRATVNSGLRFGWTRYHSLDEINNWLRSLEKKYPANVKVIKGGTSYRKRDILGIKISFKPGNKAAFIEGGIHAREWVSPATVTYIANELLSSNDPEVRKVAESRDWYIFPVFNPDGYVFTAINRLWRKTTKPYGLCIGADPNRNWGYKWNHGGTSNDSCSETYAGPKEFSESETKSLSEFISSIQSNLDAYIAFHSYSQLLLLPFGHSGLEVAENHDELMCIGKNAVQALSQRYGTTYKVGSIPEVIYVASGSSMDWVRGTFRHIRLAYTYELRDTGRYGFLLPPQQIIPTGQETLDSLVSMFKQVDES